jgi:hypothetical protein
MAIARASVTRLVRMGDASCQPVTIRVARPVTVARYAPPGLEDPAHVEGQLTAPGRGGAFGPLRQA